MILRLCAAGAIAEIARVGHAPFEADDPLEVRFASGAVFYIDVRAMDATDLEIGEGSYLEKAFGHLRVEDSAAFAAIERDWTREALDLDWAMGQTLSSPRRLIMAQPYRVDVGYVFACGGRELAIFGEADLIYAAALADRVIADYDLEIGAPIV